MDDWSNMEQVRAEYERTGFNRTDEPPEGMAVEDMSVPQRRAWIYRKAQERLATEGAK